jgi:hypothetical protein
MCSFVAHILVGCAMVQTPEMNFISEIRDSLRDLQQSYAHLRVEGTLTEEIHAPKTQEHDVTEASVVVHYQYICSGGRTKLTMAPDLERNTNVGTRGGELSRKLEIVFINDHDKVIFLQRRVGTRDYGIGHIGRPPAKGQVQFDTYAKALALAPFTMWTVPLPDNLDSPAFIVHRVDKTVDGTGIERARVEFTRKSTGRLFATLTGYFLVEKKPRWRLSGINMRASFPGPSKLEMIVTQTPQYDDSREGSPLSTVVFTKENLKEKFVESDRLEVSRIEFTPPDPSEFTLDAYGLGSVIAKPNLASSLPLHWIFFGIAGGALILRVALVFLNRRTAASPAH